MLIEVAHLCHTFELDVGIVDAHKLWCLGWVVESDGASRAFESLDILDKDVGAIVDIVLGNIGLQSQ